MGNPLKIILCIIKILLFINYGIAQDHSPVAWWTFSRVEDRKVFDKVTQTGDSLEGQYWLKPGISGNSILLDGTTTGIVRKSEEAPRLQKGFTIEAWVALSAYPWNWCPVVSHNQNEKSGYRFTIGPRGQVGLEVSVNDAWQTCISDLFRIPLREWVHVAGTYHEKEGLKVYVNGKEAGHVPVSGMIRFARRTALRIGMVDRPLKPSHIHREHGTLSDWFSLDGLLDELKIYDTAFSSRQLLAVYKTHGRIEKPQLPSRKMPSGPGGPGRFGAVYTHLKYYEAWDALWPVDRDPDVVVRFDKSPVRVVFWRGSRYSPAWVSENDLWMADQSVEAWNHGDADAEGCFEHMQDRHCRYSHVRIIENHDARVVIHWRYAPVSAYDNLWREDEKTGWACWIDEYYYIYPDAMGIRKPTWKKGSLGHPRQFQESLPFTHPGQLIGDVIQKDFAVVGNLHGETATLSFVKKPDKNRKFPENLTLQRYNFKAENKPFILFEPGNRMHYVSDRRLGPRGLDVPGACNHWPVGQARCDGRSVYSADRPTHFLGFPISDPVIHEKEGRCWWNGLYGMTQRPMKDLVMTARSWIYAPKLEINSPSFESQGYDLSQRAYVVRRTSDSKQSSLRGEFRADEDSPIRNVCLVVHAWGDSGCRLIMDGREVERSSRFRWGHVYRLERTDLVVWIENESIETVSFELLPVI